MSPWFYFPPFCNSLAVVHGVLSMMIYFNFEAFSSLFRDALQREITALLWMCLRVLYICNSIDGAIEMTQCNFWLQYVVLAPGFIYSIYQYMVKDEAERDISSLVIIPLLLWRMIHNQIWISLSRHRTAKGNARIVDKGIEFDQVDRERNWSVFASNRRYFTKN